MQQYLSEFEVLSEAIVPPGADPNTPFVIQGYFLLVSRLSDSNVGELPVSVTFIPTPAFPPATSLLVDIEDDTGANQFLSLDANDQITFKIGSGKTILLGIQPNVINFKAGGPFDPTPNTGGTFGVRGYVTIGAGSLGTSKGGSYQLAVTPEIRATFLTVTKAVSGGVTTYTPNFTGVSATAYALPTANGPLISITKAKETKEKEKEKEHKDKEKDKDKETIKDKFKDIEQEPLQGSAPGLAQRVAAIEELLGMGTSFIGSDSRPNVG